MVSKTNGNWQNRIVGYGTEAPDQLLANPLNFRIHPKDQQSATEGSLDSLGWIDDVIINKTTGHVVDGHLRVTLALRHGAKEVPVKYVELTEDEERQALLSLDPIAAMAATDKVKLDELIHGIQSDNEQVQRYIEDLAKREGIEYGNPPEDPGAQIDKAEELREKWGVESGQLWKLGEHRLICGDCTDKAVVERVMQGEKAQLVFTSPPYWVGMSYENQKDIEEIKKFIGDVTLAVIPFVSIDNSRVIINTGTGRATAPTLEVSYDPETWLLLDWWRDALYSNSWKLRHIRIWIKQGGFPVPRSPMTDVVDQHWEFIATFYNPNGKKRGQNRVDSSWAQQGYWADIPGEARQSGHIAAFPVELPSRNIELYAEKNELVIDPFLGSGTTLIACERLGRKARCIEISPAYCAVAIQRWVDMTGGEPELID